MLRQFASRKICYGYLSQRRGLLIRPSKPAGATSFKKPDNILRRSYGSRQDAEDGIYHGRFDSLKTEFQRRFILFRGWMLRKRYLSARVPIIGRRFMFPFTVSDLSGHLSFVFLALSYLESDFMNLRIFAASGLSMSIIFQYYREKPLWIPIRWNSLFLFINGVMILLLIKEDRDAQNIPEEQHALFKTFFESKGLKSTDFLHLMSIGSKREVKKGERLVSVGDVNDHLYFVQSGTFSVELEGEQMADIKSGSFAGHMSFKEWSGKHEAILKARSIVEATIGDQYRQWITTGEFAPITLMGNESMGKTSVRINHLGDFEIESLPLPSNPTTSSSSSSPSSQSSSSSLTKKSKYEDSSGEYGKANVTALEDCLVYSWSFKKLYEAMILYPKLGFVFEQLLSQDLNNKLSQTWSHNIAGSKNLKYRSVLTGALISGEVSMAEKQALEKFRADHSISKDEHVNLLSQLGWTLQDYDAGQKGAGGGDVVEKYQQFLQEMMQEHTPLTSECRKRARIYRQEHNIGYQSHLTALHRLGWNEFDWEDGEKILPVKQQPHHEVNVTKIRGNANGNGNNAFNPFNSLRLLLGGTSNNHHQRNTGDASTEKD